MSFFLYPSRFDTRDADDTLVVFWVRELNEKSEKEDLEKSLESLRPIIREYLSSHLLFSRILFITHERNSYQFPDIKKYFTNNQLTYSLSLKDVQKGLSFASFGKEGQLLFFEGERYSDLVLEQIMVDGLAEIFRNRGGLIGPSDHVHYILPSGKHSEIFVRTGNIFKIGVEISFVGFCLLKYLRDDIRRVYCDTSSIIVAAQAAFSLRKILDPAAINPDINSFGSYKGSKTYVFLDPDQSLFLISASYSGGLANIIHDKIEGDVSDDCIITLFKFPFYSKHSPGKNQPVPGKVVCDLEKVDLRIDLKSVTLYEHDCELCDKHSIAIPITGDEFMPERRAPKRVIVTEKHKPKWFNEFMVHFIGTRYIMCHRKKKLNEDNRELYIDIEKLHEEKELDANKEYNKKFTRYLNRKLPAALRLVVFLDDPASETVANQINEFYVEQTSSESGPQLLRYDEADQEFVQKMTDYIQGQTGSILVVASSIAQSRSILKISRDLRNLYQSGCQLCYFVSIVRTYTEKEFQQIRTNLLFSKQFGLDTFLFDSLINIFIPDERYRNDTPWQQELDLLLEFFKKDEDELGAFKKEALKKFEDRLERLSNAAGEGLIDDLFWNSPDDQELRLNHGFVFFDFYFPAETVISQADVYFTVASVLHNLRTDYKEANQILLEQSEYQRKILDPVNFNRFNDGIIQACFIRAAQSVELDYSHDESASVQMAGIIRESVVKKDKASYEYLLALAVEKIKLTPFDSVTLYRHLLEDEKFDDDIVPIFLSMYFDSVVQQYLGEEKPMHF